jgi:hypothetical protein
MENKIKEIKEKGVEAVDLWKDEFSYQIINQEKLDHVRFDSFFLLLNFAYKGKIYKSIQLKSVFLIELIGTNTISIHYGTKSDKLEFKNEERCVTFYHKVMNVMLKFL